MPDYREMYLHLARETEKAVRILIAAQQECEELYMSAPKEAIVPLQTSFCPGAMERTIQAQAVDRGCVQCSDTEAAERMQGE